MNKSINRIQELIKVLPEKDAPLGYKFLKVKDFESLKELVDSALYKVEKSIELETSKNDELEIEAENLSKLKSEVDIYTIQIELSNYYKDSDDDSDNYEINSIEEWY